MIHNFYILKKNGICIYHKKFGSLEEDPQSIGGFLTAISMFSKSIIGEQIKVLATANYKFVFRTDDKFTFVTFTDNQDNQSEIHRIMEIVRKNFYQNFPNLKSDYDHYNLKYFEIFDSTLTKILKDFQ